MGITGRDRGPDPSIPEEGNANRRRGPGVRRPLVADSLTGVEAGLSPLYPRFSVAVSLANPPAIAEAPAVEEDNAMRKPAPPARPRSRATPRPRAAPAMGETEFHLRVADLLRLGVPPGGGFWFHVPNQGKRSKATAGLFKGMGLLAGVADIVLVSGQAGGGGRVAFLELKAPNGKGSLRAGQEDFRDMCQALGIAWAEENSLAGVEAFARRFYEGAGLTFRARAQ